MGTKRKDFLEYFEDADGKVHIMNVYCKSCGARIQTGTLVKNHLGKKVPVLRPEENYVDLYIACMDADGVMKRKSTPMCQSCATGPMNDEDLQEIHEADNEIMVERHRHSGVDDRNIDEYLRKRSKMRMIGKIGYCVPGYAIVGEGR